MKIDIDCVDDLLKQADRWLRDGATETDVPLKLRWAGKPDTFEVEYDREKAGLLVLAIASDPVLAAVAWTALLKVISEYGDFRMRAALQEFAAACASVHWKMAQAGCCDGDFPIMFVRNGSGN